MAGEWTECSLADACRAIDYGLTAAAADGSFGPKFLRITDRLEERRGPISRCPKEPLIRPQAGHALPHPDVLSKNTQRRE
jgi:hypothetical protein